jgi:hypothetical protein
MSLHPSVGFDNRAATHQLARHLIGLGHRRFGLISADPQGNDRARERGAGVRAALAEAGLQLQEPYVQYARISLASAQAAMARMLLLEPRPTAVLATNDVLAVGAMLACREAGVGIPHEISITGVDNTDLGATQTPGLTSVRTPIVEIGRAAADQLMARLEGRVFTPVQSLPFDLVFRGSIGPPPAALQSRKTTAKPGKSEPLSYVNNGLHAPAAVLHGGDAAHLSNRRSAMSAIHQPEGSASDTDESLDGPSAPPVPNEDGPHDVPDENVIEKTLPTRPLPNSGNGNG